MPGGRGREESNVLVETMKLYIFVEECEKGRRKSLQIKEGKMY